MSSLDDLISSSRTGKFISVGAFGAVIDLSISYTVKLSGLLSAEWAKLVGAEFAIIIMFFLNDRWTFARYGSMAYLDQSYRLFKSNLVRSIGLLVQFGVVWYLTRLNEVVIAGIDVWAMGTMPIAIICSFLVNYLAENLVTWQVQTKV